MGFLGGYRYAAFGAVSEAELEKFAKKVAAGKKATTDFETAAELINRLPGWSASPAVVAFPADDYRAEKFLLKTHRARVSFWGASTSKEAATVHSSSYSELFSLVDRGIINVFSPEAAASPREGVLYVENLFDRSSSFQSEQVGRLYLGVPGLIVTAPSVASAKVPNPVGIGSDPSDPGVFGLGSFWTWAKSTNFVEAVKSLANAVVKPPTEREEAIQRIGTLDHTGHCPVCGRIQKLYGITKGRPVMYDHGYQFAEGFWKQGSCFGVGYPPFEISPAGALARATNLDSQAAYARKQLTEVLSGTIVLFNLEPELDEQGRKIRVGPVGNRQDKMKTVEYLPGSIGYAELQQKRAADLSQAIPRIEAAAAEMRARARSWKRVPTYDEEKAGRLLY